MPTPPQAQGWPAIARGEHSLIISPTGSGKTLTAFLWSLDTLFRDLDADETAPPRAGDKPPRYSRAKGAAPKAGPSTSQGIRVVYVSPLKALNNDVERNLQVPLAGIRRHAERAGMALPHLRVAVRTGDTPSSERQSMVRHPPHVLITTPESLYLMLTAERARQTFATVHTVIVDEIHTVVGSKRGAHLAMTLERLERLVHESGGALQRIGLSATVRPLENAASFLGGQDPAREHAPRPVTIVDAGYKKPLDLRVITAVDDFRSLPGNSIWTAVIPEVSRLVEEHHTTLVFCNSRRLAERSADRLNEHRLMHRLAELNQVQGSTFKVQSDASNGPRRDIGEREGSPLPEGEGVHSPLPLGEAARRAAEGSAARRGAGVVADLGMFAAGVDAAQLEAVGLQPIRAHHGSMSKVARLEMEQQLKAGTLPALVATSSLELGIDIGDVDLVVQLQAPKSVASGLQRIGRSGHLVGQTSVGRIFTTHVEDVVEAAAVAHSMLRGEIEATHTPENPLDVLAQQIMAMVGTDDWAYDDLFATVRGAYPYRNLSEATFRAVLEMLSGKYADSVSRHLQAKLSWDRVNNRLAALPGSRLLALQSGGTIPDRGMYSLVLADRKTKIGELDEEFVFESRTGDTFILGSQIWRIADITEERVMVEPAPGETPRMPFWRGDFPWRPYDLGKRIGAFRRTLAEMLAPLSEGEIERLVEDLTPDPFPEGKGSVVAPPTRAQDEGGGGTARGSTPTPAGEFPLPLREGGEGVRSILHFLREECALDERSTRQVVGHIAKQLDAVGQIATDRSVIVELFDDAIGDARMVVHSPFGGRVNGPWGLALASVIRERTGMDPQVTTGDDGILFRFAGGDDRLPRAAASSWDTVVEEAQAAAADLVGKLTAGEARERLLNELPNSAVFGAQFRMNAARALLLPRQRAGKRTPLWLTRLQSKDLLQAVQRFKDFPILLETYRDCLRDVMDLDGLTEVLDQIQRGEIQVTVHESQVPSPVAMGLDYRMAMQYVYEYDAPRGEKQLAALSLDRSLLADLLQDTSLADLLKPEAIATVTERVSHTGPETRARSAEELAQILYDLGDLTEEEIRARCIEPPLPLGESRGEGSSYKEWMRQLSAAGRVLQRDLGASGELRWIHAERRDDYDRLAEQPLPALRRYLMHAGPTTTAALAARYGLSEVAVRDALQALGHEAVQGEFTPGGGTQWIDRRTLEQIHRRTLTLLRKEVQPVPLTAYAAFLQQWQHVGGRADGLGEVLQQLRGFFVPAIAYERDVLPARIAQYDPEELAERCQAGEVMWVVHGGRDPKRARVAFFFRGEGGLFLERTPAEDALQELTPAARTVYDFLAAEGAALLPDICDAAELARAEAQQALVELVLARLVTNDTLGALHAVLGYETPPVARPALQSTLQAQLASRMPDHRPRQTPGRMRDARRRAREAVAARLGAPLVSTLPARSGALGNSALSTRHSALGGAWAGRWSLVHRQSLLGRPLPEGERALRQARQLLQRWGVVTKACLEREQPALRWEVLYSVFAALEMRGEVRRGYFVAGLPGVQFALPEVVDRLREASTNRRPMADMASVAPVVLSAVDPAQLYGTDEAGGPLRFARVATAAVAFHQGDPVAAMEESGSAVSGDLDHPAVVPCLRALACWWRERQRLRLKVERWAGAPVLPDSPGAPLLEAAGFVREAGAMLWVDRPQG